MKRKKIDLSRLMQKKLRQGFANQVSGKYGYTFYNEFYGKLFLQLEKQLECLVWVQLIDEKY